MLLTSLGISLICAVSASTVDPTGKPEYVGYVGDTNRRGTLSLVLSCLLTLILCVWSALHLNVPQQKRSTIRTIWINVRWVFAGIYSPEMVVFAAWRQWCSARLLNDHVAALNQAKGTVVPWSMTHSFFACAGGFAFELESLNGVIGGQSSKEEQRPVRLTLTARGMMLLADTGHLPVVERAVIDDKSKANNLAKAAVLVQATWMIIQVIGRLAARLPVTLLEVNTVAHV